MEKHRDLKVANLQREDPGIVSRAGAEGLWFTVLLWEESTVGGDMAADVVLFSTPDDTLRWILTVCFAWDDVSSATARFSALETRDLFFCPQCKRISPPEPLSWLLWFLWVFAGVWFSDWNESETRNCEKLWSWLEDGVDPGLNLWVFPSKPLQLVALPLSSSSSLHVPKLGFLPLVRGRQSGLTLWYLWRKGKMGEQIISQ